MVSMVAKCIQVLAQSIYTWGDDQMGWTTKYVYDYYKFVYVYHFLQGFLGKPDENHWKSWCLSRGCSNSQGDPDSLRISSGCCCGAWFCTWILDVFPGTLRLMFKTTGLAGFPLRGDCSADFAKIGKTELRSVTMSLINMHSIRVCLKMEHIVTPPPMGISWAIWWLTRGWMKFDEWNLQKNWST